MGFKNDDPERTYYPAYAKENNRRVKGVPEADVLARLQSNLAALELEYEELPAPARAAFEARQVFTIVQIGGVKDWASRRSGTVRTLLRNLHEDLVEHAQVALTLETCDVWVIVDGQSVTQPLSPRYPEPFVGFEDVPRTELPEQLCDPETGEMVNTGSGERGFLQLKTSSESLRRSDRRKAMNVIRVRNTRNIVGNWSVADLAPRPESTFIYGTVMVPAFTRDHQVGSERHDMADVPLVRAVRAWVADQVEELAARIQQSQTRHHRPEDRSRANDALERLRNLMKRFLQPENGGTPEREYGEEVTEIILEANRPNLAIAVGTSIPLQVNCYEVSSSGKRRPVLRPNIELVAAEPSLVSFADGVLKAVAPGRTRIRMCVVGTNIESNAVEVETIVCNGVDVIVPDRTLLQSEHVKITSIFRTQEGERDDLLIEARTRQDFMIDGMVDEAEMGKLNRTGWFTAGRVEGTATIRVRYGPNQQDTKTASVNIGSEVAPPPQRPPGQNQNSGDIPLILMCGATVPGLQEYPPDQRTHAGGDHHPTVIMMEPPFEQVVWINPNSKEATRVRQERGGEIGVAIGVDRIASRASLQFFALKCFEILKHLKVRQDLNDTTVTDVSYRNALAQAEMDCAEFVDAAFDLADNLHNQAESH
jgi:hypothetical protein